MNRGAYSNVTDRRTDKRRSTAILRFTYHRAVKIDVYVTNFDAKFDGMKKYVKAYTQMHKNSEGSSRSLS